MNFTEMCRDLFNHAKSNDPETQRIFDGLLQRFYNQSPYSPGAYPFLRLQHKALQLLITAIDEAQNPEEKRRLARIDFTTYVGIEEIERRFDSPAERE